MASWRVGLERGVLARLPPVPGGAVYIEVCHDCFMVYRYTMDLRRDPIERVTVKSPESAVSIAMALIQDGSPSPEPSPLP